jgi:hypothetical protein
MFTKIKRSKSPLDTEIEALLERASVLRNTPEEYTKTMNEVERLYALKKQDTSRRIHPETALQVGANLLGIAVIVRHEQFNVITTKAMSMLPKIR